MKRFSGRWAVVCALAAAASPQVASAAAIAGAMHESFSDYVAGTAFANTPPAGSQNGGPGWNTSGLGTLPNDAGAGWGAVLNAGVLRTVTSPGLNYTARGYLAPTGNKLTLDAASTNVTQNIGRTLGGQNIDSGTTYLSFLISRNTVDTQRTINLAFFNDTNERWGIGQIGAAAGNTAGNIALLMNNSNPGGIVQSATPIAMGNDVTHLIVGRIDWNAAGFETVSIWVDPTNVTTEASAGAVYASTNAFELTNLTRLRPFTGNTAGGFNGVSANFDEIRLGGTWEAVTSQAIVVPEPGVLGLAAVALGGLMGRRRRA